MDDIFAVWARERSNRSICIIVECLLNIIMGHLICSNLFHFKFHSLNNPLNCDLPERWITQINPRNLKTTANVIKTDSVQHLNINFISFSVCILRITFRSWFPRPWQNKDHVTIVSLHNFPSISWNLCNIIHWTKLFWIDVLQQIIKTRKATRIILSLS